MSRKMILPLLAIAFLSTPALGAAPKSAATSFLPGGDSKAPVQIDAEKLNYFNKERKAVYSGHVIAKQGETSLQTDMLSIFLDEDHSAAAGDESKKHETPIIPTGSGNQVRRMEAEGSVIVKSRDQVGTGDRGWYEKGENKVYLVGNVSLSQGSNVAKGEKLVYDLTTGQAQIVGRVSSLFTPKSEGEKK